MRQISGICVNDILAERSQITIACRSNDSSGSEKQVARATLSVGAGNQRARAAASGPNEESDTGLNERKKRIAYSENVRSSRQRDLVYEIPIDVLACSENVCSARQRYVAR